jgi:16S rRNA (guanine527-N7)-methyltransferase
MTSEAVPASIRLNELLEAADLAPLSTGAAERFQAYLSLLQRWNARVNLTAVRDREGILSRHFVESIACAGALPSGLSTLLDLGSGAGFPGIPIAICRPEIAVTLVESQGKKAAFLQEAVRVLELPTRVLNVRAESLRAQFDCVTLRAVDRMESAVAAGSALVTPGGWLALMTSGADSLRLQDTAGESFAWQEPILLPGSADRWLALGARTLNLPA